VCRASPAWPWARRGTRSSRLRISMVDCSPGREPAPPPQRRPDLLSQAFLRHGDLPHGRRGDRMAETDQLALDAAVASRRVLPGHPQYQRPGSPARRADGPVAVADRSSDGRPAERASAAGVLGLDHGVEHGYPRPTLASFPAVAGSSPCPGGAAHRDHRPRLRQLAVDLDLRVFVFAVWYHRRAADGRHKGVPSGPPSRPATAGRSDLERWSRCCRRGDDRNT
jgi:hypothetical protein